MYALFKNGKQISKSHKHKEVCVIEAYEMGYVTLAKNLKILALSVEIKGVDR